MCLFRRLLDNHEFGLNKSIQQALVSIINRRYSKIINDSPNDAYFACLALNPQYLHTDIFCERVKPAASTKLVIRIPGRAPRTRLSPKPAIATEGLVSPPLLVPNKVFQHVAKYLWEMMRSEKDLDSKLHPRLKLISWKPLKNEFMSQLHGYFPGTLPCSAYGGEPPTTWWRDRKGGILLHDGTGRRPRYWV